MEIDESDDDELIQSFVVTAKKRPKGLRITYNTTYLTNIPISALSPDVEVSRKRPKGESDRLFLPQDPGPASTSKVETISGKAASTPKTLVLILVNL